MSAPREPVLLTPAERSRVMGHFVVELHARRRMRVWFDDEKRGLRIRGCNTRYNWPDPEGCRFVGEFTHPCSVHAFERALLRAAP